MKRKARRSKRLVCDLPDHVHRAIRMRCAERGIPIRDYICELLAKDGIPMIDIEIQVR
jgi:hypothetical protein